MHTIGEEISSSGGVAGEPGKQAEAPQGWGAER